MKRLSHLALRASRRLGWRVLLIGHLGLLGLPGHAHGQEAFTTGSRPARNALEGQLVLALPAWMPVGLSEGVGLSFSRGANANGLLAWGARASWSTATEYPQAYIRRNDDIRMRILGMVQHVAGRGSFGLRLGLGGTVVYDRQTVAQGARAGLSGNELEQTAWHFFPAADLEGVVALRIWQSWGMSISAGPTLHLIDGAARWGWVSSLGVTWQL
jgi:hypothetical protein